MLGLKLSIFTILSKQVMLIYLPTGTEINSRLRTYQNINSCFLKHSKGYGSPADVAIHLRVYTHEREHTYEQTLIYFSSKVSVGGKLCSF